MIVCLHRGSTLLDHVIEWQTRGPYSHTSIILSDGRHVEARPGLGVVMHAAFSPAPGETVDQFFLATSPDQDAALAAWVTGELGCPYDWVAVLDFVTRGRPTRRSPTKWFCSEFVVAALLNVGIRLFRATEAWEVSPAMLGRSPVFPEVPAPR